MSHPNLPAVNRRFLAAGAAVALLTVPLAAPAFALVDRATQAPLPDEVSAVTDEAQEVLEPVAEPIEEAADPVTDEVDKVVAEAPVPEPVADKLGRQGPDEPAATPARTAPSTDLTEVQPAGQPDHTPTPVEAVPSTTTGRPSLTLSRASAFSVTPSMSTPFNFELPVISDRFLGATTATPATATPIDSSPVGADAPAWLLATATGMLLLVGGTHVLRATGKLQHLS